MPKTGGESPIFNPRKSPKTGWEETRVLCGWYTQVAHENDARRDTAFPDLLTLAWKETSLGLTLVGHGLHLGLQLFFVHQVILLDELQVVIELIHERDGGGNVELQNLLLGHVLQELADRPE